MKHEMKTIWQTLIILFGAIGVVGLLVLGSSILEALVEFFKTVARAIERAVQKLLSIVHGLLVFSWWNIIAGVVLIIIGSAWFIHMYFFKSGKLDAVAIRPPVCVEALDRNGAIIDYLCPFAMEGVRLWRPLSQIPMRLREVVVMLEDDKFYGHSGLDVDEIINSIQTDLERRKFARGASTITQQLVKNLFLTKDKSVVRKASEIPITMRVESELTKDQILELYLNTIEWGEGIYGVEAASRLYFDHEASTLNEEEAWLLALMVPNPKELNLWIAPKAKASLLKRAKNLSTRLHLEHKATRDEAHASLARFETFIEKWMATAPAMNQPLQLTRIYPIRWKHTEGLSLSDLRGFVPTGRKARQGSLKTTLDREQQAWAYAEAFKLGAEKTPRFQEKGEAVVFRRASTGPSGPWIAVVPWTGNKTKLDALRTDAANHGLEPEVISTKNISLSRIEL